MLILILNQALDFWYKDQNGKIFKIADLKPQPNGKLELHKQFESFWIGFIWPKLHLSLESLDTKILFILGPKASFTDSRVVKIWLNSFSLFNQEDNYLFASYLELENDPNEPDYISKNINNVVSSSIWSKRLSGHIYTREPSIGSKVTR